MAVTAKMVKDLRESTGAGMMDCKNALTEAAETETEEAKIMETAVELLRKKGIAKAAKRLDRETSEGLVVAHSEGNKITMISVTCETDFVSRNDDFKQLAQQLLDHAVASGVNSLDEYLASNIDGKTVTEFLAEKTGTIGEKVEVKHFVNLNSDGMIAHYIHSNSKVGTLVDLNTNASGDEVETFGKDVAMHVAAMKPIALDRDSVDKQVIEKELDIIKDQLRNEGKPEEMIDKISMGKLNRFYKDNCLVEQIFVKSEEGKSIKDSAADLAKSVGDSIEFNSYSRIAIGE